MPVTLRKTPSLPQAAQAMAVDGKLSRLPSRASSAKMEAIFGPRNLDQKGF
jgi:hypothetical protein